MYPYNNYLKTISPDPHKNTFHLYHVILQAYQALNLPTKKANLIIKINQSNLQKNFSESSIPTCYDAFFLMCHVVSFVKIFRR